MIWLVIAAAAVGAGWLFGRGDAEENLRAARAGAAADLLGASLGLSLGLLFRERVRLRRAHASPTLSYLGKRLFLASAVAAAAFALAPVSWPPPVLHGLAAAGAAGLALWSANLPVKL
ncbi:MAG TPA: hypothetical protein VF950_03195 [Planctomycetota bacterium]